LVILGESAEKLLQRSAFHWLAMICARDYLSPGVDDRRLLSGDMRLGVFLFC
jgi:hypothetical protein